MPLNHESFDPTMIEHAAIAIDPGVETGVLIVYRTVDRELSMMPGTLTGSPAQQVIDINDILNRMHRLDEVVIEKFEVSARTLKGGSNATHTAELYFGLKVFLEMGDLMGDSILPTFHYRVSDIKSSITDDYMKMRDYWIPGNKQHRDAMRLFLYHARKHSDKWGDTAK